MSLINLCSNLPFTRCQCQDNSKERTTNQLHEGRNLGTVKLMNKRLVYIFAMMYNSVY